MYLCLIEVAIEVVWFKLKKKILESSLVARWSKAKHNNMACCVTRHVALALNKSASVNELKLEAVRSNIDVNTSMN